MTVKVTVNNQPLFKEMVKKLSEKQVYVGIRGGGERRPLDGEASKQGKIPTNAEIAYVNEFGSTARNIPPRPFLIPAVNKKKEQVEKVFESNLKVALNELDPSHIDKTLEAAGTLVRDTAKMNITNSVDMQDLSEKTVKRRKKRGFVGTKPLIETGQLVGSIDYAVE